MEWTHPAIHNSLVWAIMVVLQPLYMLGGSIMQVTTLGLDLAKNVVPVHGVDAKGHVVLRKRFSRTKVLAVPRPTAPVPHWARSLRRSPSLGARVVEAGPYRQADEPAVCPAIHEEPEKRC